MAFPLRTSNKRYADQPPPDIGRRNKRCWQWEKSSQVEGPVVPFRERLRGKAPSGARVSAYGSSEGVWMHKIPVERPFPPMDRPLLPPAKVKPKKIPGPTIKMADIKHLLDVDYNYEDPCCLWSISEPASRLRKGTNWLETVLNDIKPELSWGPEPGETLARTILGLLLPLENPLRPRIVFESPITTTTTINNLVISGRCDYVLGYGSSSAGNKVLDLELVAIEALPLYTQQPTSSQLIWKLVGLQQRRKAVARIAPFVYGISFDGCNFLFYRLNAKLHLQSAYIPRSKKALVCRYLDVIFAGVNPLTTDPAPAPRLPAPEAMTTPRLPAPKAIPTPRLPAPEAIPTPRLPRPPARLVGRTFRTSSERYAEFAHLFGRPF